MSTARRGERERLERMLASAQSWYGGLPTPPDYDLDPGETIYLVLPDAELVELHETEPPLLGGSSGFSFAAAAAMAEPGAVLRRSVWLDESVPARDSGLLVVTNRRVTLTCRERTYSWSFAQLRELTHDEGVPETWLAVANRPRLSGLRYPAAAAADVRFGLALALATARGERAALVDVINRELSQLPAASRGTSTAARVLTRVYLGKPSWSMPARVLQGSVAAVLTLTLIGAVLPDQHADRATLSASGSAATSADAADRAAGEAAARAAADQAAADQAAADQAAREAAAARAAQAAAAKAAADKAAAVQAAAARLAAQRAAAVRAAAARAAAAQASAAALASVPQPVASSCTPAYPDFCIPLRVGDAYNCPDFTEKRFTALPDDPYRLDRDHDGIACES